MRTFAVEALSSVAAELPDVYGSKAQLRTLQRRVKTWRAEHAKDLILGRLRQPQWLRPMPEGRVLRARRAMDIWTMRLRLPTARAFAHMPTAFDHQ